MNSIKFENKIDAIFMNSEKSETSDRHRQNILNLIYLCYSIKS